MPQSLTSASTDSTIIPLQDILALHRALVFSRSQSADLDAFLRDVLETLRQHLHADGALIGLRSPGRKCLERVTMSGAASAVPAKNCLEARLPWQGRAGRADPDAAAQHWARGLAVGQRL